MAPTTRAAQSAENAIVKGVTPPEKPSETSRRSYIIFSYWLLVILLGIPLWWKTTNIYRANLPVDGMLEWANGKACQPVFPLDISVRADSLAKQDAEQLLRLTQQSINAANEGSGHKLHLQLADEASKETALTINLKPGASLSASFDQQSPVLDITYAANDAPKQDSGSSPLATFITNELHSTFAEEQNIISYLLSASSMSSGQQQHLSPEEADALSKRTTRSLRYSPTYHLSFSLFTDGPLPNTWDIDAALNEYLTPMLDLLRPIHNFTVDTQVQLYAAPGVQSSVLNKENLASFINAAEWPLSPSIGDGPTLNFVIYVGNQTISLDAQAETSQSWMIPQWGTVYLLSQSQTEKHVSLATLKQPMLTFGGHLLQLLGTPQTGSLPLRLSALTRIRSTDLLLRASSSLGSLARLTRSLSSIAIPRNVADGVASSMHHLEQACSNLGGRDGLQHSRIAEAEAEKAFFEKSMVGQLYFPDEHKIAVYLPLLGPISVPLIMALIAEIKGWVQRRKQKAQDSGEKKAQ